MREPQPSEESTPRPEPPFPPTTSLKAAMGAFEQYMRQQDFAENTIKSFLNDLKILTQFTGVGRAVGHIGTRDLEEFLEWMQTKRGVPCSPKSLARRITTLKVFFGWLTEAGVLLADPAAPIIHHPVSTPLPTVLSDEEVERLLQTTQAIRRGNPPDARPHLLVTLVLHTGIKKGECVQIELNHLDLSNPAQPFLWIRYKDPRHHHKERKLGLPDGWTEVLAEYREQYKPQDRLFPWTARNLEYVLRDVAKQADLPRGLSFAMLRWTCALRDYKAGMPEEKLRRKLGLSHVGWREAKLKLTRLAERPL
ncbi:MAG: hypothetical protein D6759_03710 [Chloroflexi bacterium]|nr:MAG: hypothetical protein D6759_03710 [Chloroflexota bacterium]